MEYVYVDKTQPRQFKFTFKGSTSTSPQIAQVHPGLKV